MRLFATERSYAEGETSILAIVETMLAIGLAVLLTVWTGSFFHVICWSVIGWSLLMRTDLSAHRACRIFYRVYAWNLAYFTEAVRRYRDSGGAASVRLVLAEVRVFWTTLLFAPVARLVAGAWTFFRNFFQSVLAIPGNWLRMILCLDSMAPLEFVPGFREYAADRGAPPADEDVSWALNRYQKPTWQSLRDEGRRHWWLWLGAIACGAVVIPMALPFTLTGWAVMAAQPAWSQPWAIGLGFLAFGAVGLVIPVGAAVSLTPLRYLVYIPPIAYRLAVKATAITYFPLLIGTHRAASNVPLMEQYRELLDGRLSAYMRRLALFFIALFALRVIVFSLEVQAAERVDAMLGSKYLKELVSPYAVPGWQWATFFNSLLTVGFYLLADQLVLRVRRDQYVNEAFMKYALKAVFVVSGLLSMYSIGSNVWLILHSEPFLKIPGLGPILPEAGGGHFAQLVTDVLIYGGYFVQLLTNVLIDTLK